MKTKHGCLISLLAFALLGAYATWSSDWGDDGAGTSLAVGLTFGLIIVLAGSALESLTTRPKKDPPAFPIEPRPPESAPVAEKPDNVGGVKDR